MCVATYFLMMLRTSQGPGWFTVEWRSVISKLTSTDPAHRRLALSIFVSMVGAVALSFCLSNGHENACGGAPFALMLTGKGSCLSIICSQHVQYIIEVFPFDRIGVSHWILHLVGAEINGDVAAAI